MMAVTEHPVQSTQSAMPRRKTQVRLRTVGIHSKWDSDAKRLPRLIQSTHDVPARIDIEFGLVVEIQNAKNRELEYCIEHPGILDADGQPRPPFDGIVYVKSNRWDFYLGDTIWSPMEDKIGNWRMWLQINGEVIADETFRVFDPGEAEAMDR